MQVIFSDRAYAAVIAETTEKIKTETGGLFLGAFKDDTWYIIEAIDPGPNAVFQVTYFEYDKAYTQHLIRKVANLYDNELRLIGLWHRHPGSFDVFSATDDETNAKYARLNDAGAISALINIDPHFRITMYHVGRLCKYRRVPYSVGDSLIPARLFKLKSPQRFEDIMQRIAAGGGRGGSDAHTTLRLKDVVDRITPQMTKADLSTIHTAPDGEAADELIEALLDDLSFLEETLTNEYTVLRRGRQIQLAQEADGMATWLYFSYDQSADKVFVEIDGHMYDYEPGLIQALFLAAETDTPSCDPTAGGIAPPAADTRQKSGSFTQRMYNIFRQKNGDGQ